VKRLLMGLMLLVTATAASAEWTVGAANDVFTSYVDITTIRINGDVVKMWDLKDFKKVQVIKGGFSGPVRSFVFEAYHEV
jgi:hypothetical protein